ncbi:MAG TPA: fumarylacetoacetate hydrolase family protein [Polyangia bacterium]|jgi:2-dehydro-3-deoxy-D-arabinonate dehydratase|nr:fumarylacetoacetate hydrolase family protein [Polyangia bacterium]
MLLTRHQTPHGPCWALDGRFLPTSFTLDQGLQLPKAEMEVFLRGLPALEAASGPLLPPLEPAHEVWAAGVTYLRSREAREAESAVKDVYARVYDAPRPELFWKSLGWRVAGHQMPIRVRADSRWNAPEPELTLVVNAAREIVGFCVGNDVSSRDIEGENPLYLPQAKVYDGSCALGPGLQLGNTERLKDLAVEITIGRAGRPVFQGATRTSQIKRPLEELTRYLGQELEFPRGAFLMTGTGIVPPPEFSLTAGDVVAITIGGMTLENAVAGRV